MSEIDKQLVTNILNMLNVEFNILTDEYKETELNYSYVKSLNKLLQDNLKLLDNITSIVENYK